MAALIGPGPRAVHAANRLDPDWEWQECQVAEDLGRAPSASEYLGDSHTHPLGRAHPSTLDEETARSIRDFPDARNPVPLMAIGTSLDANMDFDLRAYHLVRGRLRRIEVEMRE